MYTTNYFLFEDFHKSSKESSNYSLVEYEDRYLLIYAIPGVKEKDLEISLDKDTLRVKADSYLKIPEGIAGSRNLVEEEEYRLTITGVPTIDSDLITAKLQDGLLSITLPKPEEEKSKLIKLT